MINDIPEINLTPPDYPEEEEIILKCACCDKEIKDKHYYKIDEILCIDCLNENYRFETENYKRR